MIWQIIINAVSDVALHLLLQGCKRKGEREREREREIIFMNSLGTLALAGPN